MRTRYRSLPCFRLFLSGIYLVNCVRLTENLAISDAPAARNCSTDTEFSCDGDKCVPKNHFCDGTVDCSDGTDEPDSCAIVGNRACTIVEFRCKNDKCIPLQHICDGRNDCRDSSDETIADCTNPCDVSLQFYCPANPKNHSCFSLNKTCDGVLDCVDGRDERDCAREAFANCGVGQFVCDDGKCVPKESRCNQFVDCYDGSDELNCGCNNATEIQCQDKSRCIYKEWRCDGQKDCLDGSDEISCINTVTLSTCVYPNRLCGKNAKQCVTLDKFCDEKLDCDDQSDEGALCNARVCMPNPCVNGTCRPMPDGTFSCICEKGLQLDAVDNQICKKMDLCAHSWGICSQSCINTADGGGYFCDCFPGFKLSPDKFTCASNDNRSAFLIFSSRHEIRMIDLREPDIQPVLVPSLRNTIAIDFLFDGGEKGKQLIFWTDVVDDKIYSGSLMDTAVFNIQPVVENSLPTAEGIAVDWIGKNLYWVESTLDQIEVSRVDGQHRSTIVAGNMTNPRAIVLDPEEGFLFWSDWDPDFPRIERSSMAGENRSVLVNISSVQGGKWPNGLAIDFEANPHRVYWIDAYSDAIHTVTVFGKALHEVVRGGDFIQHPFAVAVYGSHVYWTDWRTNSVHKANKWNGSNVESVIHVSTQPFDLHIVHSSLQPKVYNPCGKNNGGCSHLCLLSLKGTRQCACPHLTSFAKGSMTQCEEFRTFMVFSKSTEIRGVTLEKSHHNFIPAVINVQNATSMEVDVKMDQVYWVDAKAKTIVRACLNGTHLETVMDSPGGPRPTDIAIDWISRNIFITFAMDGTINAGEISVSTLSGEFRKTVISENVWKPISVAVSPALGKIVWSDIGNGKFHRIEIANMNGANRKLLVDDIPNLSRSARSLTFGYGDHKDYLYWVTGRTELVQCKLDMEGAKPCPNMKAITTTSIIAPVAVAFYEGSLLIAYEGVYPGIGILNLFNRSFETVRSNTSSVVSLKMFSPTVQMGTNACSMRNGNCSQLCLPISPTTRTCNCTAGYVLDPQDQIACFPINSILLFSTASYIHGISLDPSQADELLSPISRISLATALDFEAESSTIYWVDPKASSLNRIRRDLTGRSVVVEDEMTSVDSIAVDWMAGNIYWTNQVGKTVEVARLNGSSRYVVIHDNLEQPKAVAVHPGKGLLFWSDNGGKSPKIERSFLDGTSRTYLANVQRVMDITIDYEEDMVYWCDAGLDRIERAKLDFSERKNLLLGASVLVEPRSLVVFLGFLYWSDKFPQKGVIYRAEKNADHRQAVPIRQNLNASVNDVVIFSKDRQKGKNLCSVNNGGCQELCFFNGATRICACAHGVLGKDGYSCDTHTTFLLYSRGRSIDSAHLTADTNKNDPLASIRNASVMINVIGLAFDYGTSRVFYSDIQKGEIYSVLFNGTAFRSVASGIGSAEGLAFDPMLNHLYWTSYNNASIFRIDAAAGQVKQVPKRVIQLAIGDKLRNLAIDSCRQRLYWTNWNKDQPSIQRASFDGDDLTSIITTEVKTPNAITIDHKSQYIFWADALLDKIERCRMDGSERKILLWENVRHPFAITVYGDNLYWTDWIMRAIVRANKYTGLDVVKIRESLGRQPMGIIAVSNEGQNCALNPCYVNNGNCSELCYPTETGLKADCRCFNNRTVLADGVSCESGPIKCAADQFKCGNGKCIPFLHTCDLRPHCEDGSDENVEYCKFRICPSGYVSCKTSRKCVPEKLRCNRRDDCGDGSDERGCICKDDEFKCKSTGDCIKNEYKCDGEPDCGDSSDEIGCSSGRNCEITPDGRKMTPCPNSAICYLPEWVCDGDNDCGDYSDEQNCTSLATTQLPCSSDSFRCANGRGCIPSGWRCDGESDCQDHSDEDNCTSKCPTNSFECADGSCIPLVWKCDGVPECVGGSDEAFDLCHQTNCSKTDFRCRLSGLCIPGDWRCDGDTDCGKNDTSDETEGCEFISRCSSIEFRCRNNRCIPEEFRCDREDDCGDLSDERPEICGNLLFGNETTTVVPEKAVCGSSSYHCFNDVCINETLVCNNKDDCGDMSDEIGCDMIDCEPNPCGSHGKCLEKKIGFECLCEPGYVVSNKSRECVDYNECEDSFPCSHYCYNTVGSFRCVCAHNYTAINGGRFCKANSDIHATLLYTNKHFIRNISHKGDQKGMIRGNLTNAVALDFEWESQCLFWSDVTPTGSSINRWCLTDPPRRVKIIHSSTVHNPDGIAVDWIGKNLYWCDKGTDTIEVSRLDGGSRKILLKDGLQEPRALVVDPHHGYLYWSDWGQVAHIGKMGMDGSNIFRLVLDKTELGWPNALTIDYVTNTIFWADARFDYIAMADLNLQHRRRILENTLGKSEQLHHVFAMSVFEDSIFWTDWETKQIHKAHKYSGQNITSMDTSTHRPMDVQVFHPFRQSPLSFAPNPCLNGGRCANLCLLKPVNSTLSPVTKACACPENYALEDDGKSCRPNCSKAHFVCEKTFKCIPKWWECDGQDDCSDGFDERNDCGRDFRCTPGEFQCKISKQCLHPTTICDGIKQCSDGSDEDGSVIHCPTYLCLASQFKCPESNHCIPRGHVCDGRQDCLNGEDEKNCSRTNPLKKCFPLQFECKDGSCIMLEQVCDGIPQCKDRTDEMPFINCTAEPCGKTDAFRCSDKKCIPESRRCDGVRDCSDGGDETAETCGGVPGKCDPTAYFTCNNTKCISQKWVCDEEDDCGDGSDESAGTCGSADCVAPDISCDGHCIDSKYRCDSEADCLDGSDELNCNSTCPDGQSICADQSGCISDKWKCDGVVDCPDGSDEGHCDHACGTDEHTCKNKRCIPSKSWLCDGDNDCGDHSDEDAELCARFPCFPDRFRCTSGTCILQSHKCDGVKHCTDGSDETDCKEQVCSFRCANAKCLSSEKAVCNGVNDCGDNSDEDACRLNPCMRHGRCSQRCMWDNDLDNYTCVCDAGYRMMQHGKNKTCVADGASPLLLIAEQNQLRSLDYHHRRFDYRQLMELKDERISFVGVEIISPSDVILYWSSRENHVIYKQSIPKRRKERADFDRHEPTRLIANVLDPRGLAVDWIGGYLFWIDANAKLIEVAFLNGSSRTSVISSGLSDPYDLAADPESGFIFWTDISGHPRIERARFDGSDREVLVKDNIRYPTGITVDYANRRLYWADSKTGAVETMTLDGKDRQRVKHAALDRERPYSVDVFEDQLYVSTYNNHTVFKINKFGLGNATVLAKGLKRPATIVIVQEQKQNQRLPNLCDPNPCGEGFLCISRPPYDHRCICPGDSVYNNSTQKCEDLPESSCKPRCQNGGKCIPNLSGTGYVCRCPPQFSGPNCLVTKCSVYCYNNGACFFDGTSPKCDCKPPFGGERCSLNLCATSCQNNGNCTVDNLGNPKCLCPADFEGQRCERTRDECRGYCKNDGSCYLNKGKPHCTCITGFSGDFCEKGEGRCSRCHNDGTCYVDPKGQDSCRCDDGFRGTSCEECDSLKCGSNGICFINGGKPRCNCSMGFTGQRCTKDLCQGYCKAGTCIHGTPPRCMCPPGKSGERCEVENDCQCRNNGTCGPLMQIEGKFERRCKCAGKFSGHLCEIAPDCDSLNCINGGKCVEDKQYKFRCDCASEWAGSRCEIPQHCHMFCKNGGTCLPLTSEFSVPTCICRTEFMGLHCETPISAIEPSGELSATETAATIGIPLLIIIIILFVGAACFAWRKRTQSKAFQHILMEEVGDGQNQHEIAISNPMYLKDDVFEDEDVLHPDKVAFANPIYESCFYDRNGRANGDVSEKSGLLQLQDDDVEVVGTSSAADSGRKNHVVKF